MTHDPSPTRRWESWRRGPGYPPWQHANWRGKRRAMFARFLAFIGLMLVLILGGMAALAVLITRLAGGDGQVAVLVWAGGCGLALALPMLALALGARVFRSYAIPLADIMEAADAVAAGDLSVRVAERGSPDFQRLAASFNRMATELARTDQQRRNLTADIAHELRTPLHIIQGNLEGVLDGIYPPTAAHMEATLEEARQLARLVEDLRTLSSAEAGELPLVYATVDVRELLADVAASFSGRADLAGITLRVEPAEGLALWGDAGRLDQVLTNLVDNALRHTPAGGAVILAANAAGQRILISVADTGVGIPAEDLPFVFDRFWRGDHARSHQGGAGSGLGLAIAYQLVKAHGGTLRVESSPGQGATFFMELPAPQRVNKVARPE